MKTVVMNVTRPISPTASHVKGTTVTIEDDLAEYYISTGAARYATLQQTDARLLRSSIDGSPGSIVAPGGEAAGVNIATDANGNTVLVGPDGADIPLRLLQGRTKYPAFHNRRPLQHVMIPFGTALINDKNVNGTTVAVAVDTAVTFNGRPSTKFTVASGGTSPNLDVGTSGATITLDAEAQLALTRGFMVAVKTDGLNTLSSAILYVGDATYANFYTFNLEKLGVYDGWTLFGKLTVGATSTTGTPPNLAAAVRAKVRVICSANVVAGDIWVAPAYVVPQPKPTVVFTCDDGYDEWTWLVAEAAKRGIPISFGIAKDYVGTAGFLTQSEMLAIANHSSGLFELTNHATDNTNYSVAGLATYKSNVDACRDYLIGLGCDANAARCHQYVQGIFDQTLIDALQADGYLSAREVGSANRKADTLPIAIEGTTNDHLFKIPATCNLETGQSLSTVQGYITNAAQLGTAFVMGHKFEAAAGTITWIAGYDNTYGVLNLLDWLAYQRDVNGWRLLKWSQWYQEVRSGSEYDAVIA